MRHGFPAVAALFVVLAGGAPTLAAEQAEQPVPTLELSGQLVDDPLRLVPMIERVLVEGHVATDQWAGLLRRSVPCYGEEPGSSSPRHSARSTISGKAAGAKSTTKQRLKQLVDGSLGYCVASARTIEGGRVEARLRRFKVVRKVKVSGNWPMFEEQFLRRLSFRPGQRLPTGSALAASLARQEKRLVRRLRDSGYFDGRVQLRLTTADRYGRVNLLVRIKKGRAYRVGKIVVLPEGRAAGATSQTWEPAVPQAEIEEMFRNEISFYRPPFNTEQFKENIDKLTRRYHELGYPGVRINGGFTVDRSLPPDKAVRVELRIQQRKRIQLRFRGNDALSDSLLRGALTLFEAGAYDDYELAQSAAQMHKLYQARGYLEARVRFRRKIDRRYDRVTFYITEGERHRVAAVDFRGNKSISSDVLRELIKTRPYPFWGLGAGGYASNTQLRQDARRIAKLYRARGFPAVKVSADLAPHRDLLGHVGALAAEVVARTSRRKELYVRFTIEEGPRTIVERIVLSGTKALPAGMLRERMVLKPGQPFTPQKLDADKRRIVRLYAERGYPYARVTPLEQYGPNETELEVLQLTVDEGIAVRLGPVLLRGNSRTRSSVMRSALSLQKGQPFNIAKLEQGEQALRRMGVFNSVRIQVLGLGDRLSEVPVLVHVEERYDDYGAIELGAGGSTDNLVFGAFGYTWRNAFGLGASVDLRGEFGPEIQSGNINFYYPRLLGTAFGAELRLFLRNEVTERLGDLFTYGGTLTVSRELARDLHAFVSYELRRIESDERLNRPPAPFDEISKAPVTSRTGALSTSLVLDKRDNPLAPTRGFRLSSTLTWASRALFGTDDFLKVRFNGQGYLPLPWDMTFAVGVRYDHGIPLRGEQVLPRPERFFAGGDTTIRGFEEDRAFAESIESVVSPLDGVTLVRLEPQGGNIRLLTNVEFQFPLWPHSILLGLPLMGAVFIDNGFVRNSFDGFRFRDFRHGAGLALRIVTVVGFLSLEYAWPLDPQPGDPRDGRFHFNFGFVF